MRRRDLITLLGAFVFAAPLAAGAQPVRKVAIVGVLVSQPDATKDELGEFRGRLAELGYIDGGNVQFVIRSADAKLDRLPELAAELAGMKPDVIVCIDSPPTRAAINATTKIPIVMAAGNPIANGFISSLACPGGNVTGVAALPVELNAKRLQLLTEAVPHAKRIAVLFNPNDPVTAPAVAETERAAPELGVEVRLVAARNQSELTAGFKELSGWRADAVLLVPGQLGAFLQPTIEFAAQQRLPTMVGFRQQVQAGGLMSYYPDRAEIGRILAVDVDKILKGAKPADLPVQQPTRFELAINLKTAKALGLPVPQALLARANEVIE